MRLTVIATAEGEVLAFVPTVLPAVRPSALRTRIERAGLRWHTLTLPPRLAASARAGDLRGLLAGHRVRTTHGIPYLAMPAPAHA